MCSRLLTEILDKENNMDFAEVERHRADEIYLLSRTRRWNLWALLKLHFLRLGTCHGWVFVLFFFSYITNKINIFQGKNSAHRIFHLCNNLFSISLTSTTLAEAHTYLYICIVAGGQSLSYLLPLWTITNEKHQLSPVLIPSHTCEQLLNCP